MKFQGQISKMITKLNNPIDYFLPIGQDKIKLNNYLGKKIKLKFNDEIRCISCNSLIKKTYMQGYCYPCFISSPKTE